MTAPACPRTGQSLVSAIDLYYGKRPIYAVSWPDELARYDKKYELRQVANSTGLV